MKIDQKQKTRSHITAMSLLSLFPLLLLALAPVQGYAQNCGFVQGCSGTDYTNFGFNSTTAATLEYDNFISSFHATTVRNDEGKILIWGQASASNGTSDLTSITEVTKGATTFAALSTTSIPLKAAMASNATNHQRILLASDGLYAWGAEGVIIHGDLTTTTAFTKLTAIGLPDGISASQVKMIFATYHTLAIVTCDGAGYVLTSEFPSMRGDGTTTDGTGSTNLKTWARVKTSSNTNLGGIVAIRGNYKTLMALTSSNEVYTWGEKTLLGTENSATQSQQAYATKMTLPSTNTVKMIGVANYGRGQNASYSSATYYVLYEDGNLYAMGNNDLKQLGDWGTNSSPSSSARRWVQPRSSNGGAVLNNIKWISPNEHDPNIPAINVIVNILASNEGRIYNWGSNAGSMLGRTSSQQDAFVMDAFDPGQPLDNAPFSATSNIIGVETGGHTTMLVQKCQKKFGYVGHYTNGSATGTTNAFYPRVVFNTADVEICGAPSGVVTLSLEPNGATLTIGVPMQLTYSPTGGVFNLGSGSNATLTSTGVLTPTGPGPIAVTYTKADACAPTAVTLNVPANKIKINANDDFNAGVVKTTIPGNVKTNDDVPNATYGTSPTLVNKPTGSNPTITMNADGTYEFKTDLPGIYTYDVVVCPQGQSTGCPVTKLIITVTDPTLADSPLNKPHADLDLGTTKINTPITLDIKANDGPGNYNKTLGNPTITDGPSNGTAEIVGGKLVYTPNPGFTGKDTVTYQVCDIPTPPAGNCATAMAIITVLPEGINTTSAADDYNWTPKDTPVTGDVKTNDVDIESHTTTVTAQPNTVVPGKGTLVLNSDGTYTFTPLPNFVGTVDLPYTICDNGTPQACDQATLHIVVYNTTPLSVTFGEISAQLKDGQLLVNWTTEKETGNDRFEIEGSADGEHFTVIGTVKSNADANGNSAAPLHYEFSKSAASGALTLGFALLAIGGMGIFANKKRKTLFAIMAVAGLSVFYIGCKKANDQVVENGKFFIRIAQIDKDGTKTYSKVITVVK